MEPTGERTDVTCLVHHIQVCVCVFHSVTGSMSWLIGGVKPRSPKKMEWGTILDEIHLDNTEMQENTYLLSDEFERRHKKLLSI